MEHKIEYNQLTENEFKEIRKFARSFLAKDRFEEAERRYKAGTYQKSQYSTATNIQALHSLSLYLSKKTVALPSPTKSPPIPTKATTSPTAANIQTIIQIGSIGDVIDWINDAYGMSDYTIHKNETTKQNYISRHSVNEDWTKKGLNTAGY